MGEAHPVAPAGATDDTGATDDLVATPPAGTERTAPAGPRTGAARARRPGQGREQESEHESGQASGQGRHPQSSRKRARVRVLGPGEGAVVAVVSAGGALGACARYGAGLLWPTAPGTFPWTTFLVNAVGCAVIGVFLTLLAEVWTVHRLVRPFFGTGVLGGFTTFSTFAVDTQRLVAEGHARAGLVHLLLTPLVALAAVWCAARLTRYAVALRRHPAPARGRPVPEEQQ